MPLHVLSSMPHISTPVHVVKISLVFQARGDVPHLSFAAADDFNGTVSTVAAASLQGIAPMWGTFELLYGGESTSPLYADASAGE